MGAKVTVDTIYVERQIITPERHIDTVVQNVNFTDTIFVTKDNVVTKIKINELEKTVYVNTVCPPDTIVLRVPVEVIKKIDTKGSSKSVWLGRLIGFVIGALFVFMLIRFK